MKTIILKSFETGRYYKIKPDPSNIKIGDRVSYINRKTLKLEYCKVIKIIDRVRKSSTEWGGNTLPCGRLIFKTMMKEYERDKKEQEELAKLRKRPYFLTRVDYIKGNPSKKENLERIEFPCFCEFDANKGIHGSETCGQGVKGTGEINKTFTNDQVEYQLSRIGYQQKGLSVICSTPSLKRLFEIYDIEILKGEIQLWKEIR